MWSIWRGVIRIGREPMQSSFCLQLPLHATIQFHAPFPAICRTIICFLKPFTMSAVLSTARLEARLPINIHNLLKQAADLEGRSLTDFVVTAAHEAAKRSIEQAYVLRLSVADQSAFAAALIDPPKPNAALKRAFAKQRKLIAP